MATTPPKKRPAKKTGPQTAAAKTGAQINQAKAPPVKKVSPQKQTDFDDSTYVSPLVVQRFKEKFWKVYPRDADRLSDESLNWFRSRVIKDIKVKQSALLNSSVYSKKSGTENKQLIGKLYFYEYKAVVAGDSDNDIYDQYPLCFFFSSSKTKDDKTLLHGLNIHYLAPKERMILLQGLLTLRSSKTTRPGMRLKLSWEVIKSVSKHALYEKAVHSYRVDRLMSRLVEVPANDWSVVVFLQLQKWKAINDANQLYPSDYRKKTQKRTRDHMKKFK